MGTVSWGMQQGHGLGGDLQPSCEAACKPALRCGDLQDLRLENVALMCCENEQPVLCV